MSSELLLTCHQIHSAEAVIARGPWNGPSPRCDAIVTAVPGLLCGVLSADCAPILIADGHAGVVAAVHAGWRGALAGVVEAAIRAMTVLGAAPHRAVAAIGPCIGPESYEVGVEFERVFLTRDLDNRRFFALGGSAEKRRFDLPGFVSSRLAAAGVGSIHSMERDTCADEKDFFSNRRAHKRSEPDYGRLMSVITVGDGGS
jgi:YfiH family protein